MSARMRVVGWRVQPVIMLDDGSELEEQPVDPVFVRHRDWPSWDWQAALDSLRDQVEKPPVKDGE